MRMIVNDGNRESRGDRCASGELAAAREMLDAPPALRQVPGTRRSAAPRAESHSFWIQMFTRP